ncbi:hypothetical protein EDC64_1432, partial [Aquabacter spiritensis]
GGSGKSDAGRGDGASAEDAGGPQALRPAQADAGAGVRHHQIRARVPSVFDARTATGARRVEPRAQVSPHLRDPEGSGECRVLADELCVSASKLGSRSVSDRPPPPLRRTRLLGGGAASRSAKPRPMVERAIPVISETAASPPLPAARASLAANTRRPRSSRFEPSAFHRCSMPARSIMPTRLSCLAAIENQARLSHTAAGARNRRFGYPCGCP